VCRGPGAPARHKVVFHLLLLRHIHLLPLSLLYRPTFSLETELPDNEYHDGNEYNSSHDTSGDGSNIGSFVGRRVSKGRVDCGVRRATDAGAGTAVWGRLKANFAFVGVALQACTGGRGGGTFDAALEDSAHDILELFERVSIHGKLVADTCRHSPLRAFLADMVAIVVGVMGVRWIREEATRPCSRLLGDIQGAYVAFGGGRTMGAVGAGCCGATGLGPKAKGRRAGREWWMDNKSGTKGKRRRAKRRSQ
jgi:hypothetical protein